MIKKFKLSAGLDISISLSVDTNVMTAEMADQVNKFWSGHAEVLAASGGDVIQAVARRAATVLIDLLWEGFNTRYAVERLADRYEGWPPVHGITIDEYELPEVDPVLLRLEE